MARLFTVGLVALAGASCERPAVRTTGWRVVVLEPADPPPPSAYREGLLEGLGEGGRDVPQRGWQTVRVASAELPARAAQAVSDGADLALTVTSAALAAALPAGPAVVFTDVVEPARAGMREASWLARWRARLLGGGGPIVTGAVAVTDFGALLAIAEPVLPEGAIGAVFAAGDVDSVALRDQLRAVSDRSVVSAPLDAAGAAAAARALCEQRARTLVLLGDRSTDAALADLVAGARACRMAVLGTRREHAAAGALLTRARDERAAALAAGRRAAAVMRGERPDLEPLERIATATLILNAQAAEQAGIGLPLSLVEQADDVVGD